MQLEQFFESLSYICLKILPMLGVVLLIYLIIMVRNLIICLKSAAKTLDEANMQLRKLDVPLHTVGEISKSIDQVHELTKESLKSISLSLFQTISALKEWLMNLIHKDGKNKEFESDVDMSADEADASSKTNVPIQDE
ncbi:hypothetical protein [uncultured Traorella sp.]|uniref:hypothetical protein n=1 Tax=uncultured Traorella sp. TaxID=1929048 RepID=UPI0025DFA51C|nr:hypothetical protein [uncultured Traorella sp.]